MARQAVIDALTAQTQAGKPLAGALVMGYARGVDPASKPVVMVRLDEVVQSPVPQVWRSYRFALVLIPTKSNPGPADDELDALLEAALFAVDRAPNLTWERAQRFTYDDGTYPSYEVTLTLPFTHT